MWKLKELKLENFMSHKDSILPLPEKEAHMIIGVNNDDEGQESNGSGKSVANEAIALAITGTALRKVKDCDLIYYGEETSTVSLSLFNQMSSKEMVITRTLFSKKSKSSVLEVFLDGEKVNTFPTVKDGNSWLIDQIGVTREDLLNYYLVSERSASFFTTSDGNKKKIVARFSNTDVLLPIKEQIKEEGKRLVEVRGGLELQLERLQERKTVYEEQLTNASTEDAEKIKQGRIDMIQRSIDDYTARVEENEKGIKSHKEQIPIHQEELALIKKELDEVPEPEDHTADIEEYQEIVDEMKKVAAACTTNIFQSRKDLREAEGFKAAMEASLEASIECPECTHKFVLRDDDFNFEEVKSSIEEVDVVITAFGDDIQDQDDKRSEADEVISDANQGISDLRVEMNKSEAARSKIERRISQKQWTIDDYNDRINRCTAIVEEVTLKVEEAKGKIEEVKEEKVKDPSIEINKTIAVVDGQIKDKEEEIDSAKDYIVKANEFEAIFTKFMTHLSNKAIRSIETRVNSYLEEMDSNLSVQFEGYKVLSTGKIRENISIVVLRNGIPEAFFDNYSKGERGRINVAGILALNDLLNSSSQLGCGLDFVCLDEAMDGIDSLGVGSVMKAINTLGQPILAVSHIEPKEPFQNTIYCIKEKGISKFETNGKD